MFVMPHVLNILLQDLQFVYHFQTACPCWKRRKGTGQGGEERRSAQFTLPINSAKLAHLAGSFLTRDLGVFCGIQLS